MAGLYSCVLEKRGRELLCVLDELGELGGVNFEDFLYCFLGSASHQGENSLWKKFRDGAELNGCKWWTQLDELNKRPIYQVKVSC